MKNVMISFLIITLSSFAFSNQEAKNVALVKVKRGKANVTFINGDSLEVKKGMWIKEGGIIKTSGKSFVRLKFIDKSSMNIGPKSEIKIEKFNKKEPGVINVLTGKIRSQVTKNYLEMDKGKSKLFIKSKSAVMGIRGTDFLFSASRKTGATTAVLFEGSVVFSKLKKGDNQGNLEKIVNRGRRIKPGEFSVVIRGKGKATVPSKLSSKQFVKLMKNDSFEVAKVKEVKKIKSVVPPGLSGEVVAGEVEVVKTKSPETNNAPENNAPIKKVSETEKVVQEDSKGFIRGDDVKPVDGSIVHIDSGTIVPLGVDSQFDKSKGEWVSPSVGSIDNYGEYIPPEDHRITDEGKILKVDTNGKIREVVTEIAPIDDVKPLDQMEKIDIQQLQDFEKGTEPERIPGGEVDPEIEQPLTDVLPTPPRPVGDSYVPPSYTTRPPELQNTNKVSGKTKATITVK